VLRKHRGPDLSCKLFLGNDRLRAAGKGEGKGSILRGKGKKKVRGKKRGKSHQVI